MTRREYYAALARLVPELADELQAVYAELGRGRRRAVEAAIRAGSADEVIRLLGLEDDDAPAAFAAFLNSLLDGFVLGGTAQALRLQRTIAFPVLFNSRLPDASRWLTRNDANLMQFLADDARQNVMRTVQDGLRDGLSVGEIARKLQRIPLTEQQRMHAQTATHLLGGGTAPPDRAYLNRQGRDPRFDAIVSRAIAEGKPLPLRTRRAIIDAYEAKARQVRAMGIARTEAIRYINGGRYESVMQMVPKGVRAILEWLSQRDVRVRHIHRRMDGQQRRPGIPFDSPLGTQLRFPGDVALGAVTEDVAGCRCFMDVRVE